MRGQARKVSRSVDRQISVLLCSANETMRVSAPWCVWCSACAGAALQQRRTEKHRKEADSAEGKVWGFVFATQSDTAKFQNFAKSKAKIFEFF